MWGGWNASTLSKGFFIGFLYLIYKAPYNVADCVVSTGRRGAMAKCRGPLWSLLATFLLTYFACAQGKFCSHFSICLICLATDLYNMSLFCSAVFPCHSILFQRFRKHQSDVVVLIWSRSTGNPGNMGESGNMGNRYMQIILLRQRVFSLPTSVAACADYYTNQLICNSSLGLKQSLVILSFDPLLNCLFADPSKFAK